MPHLTDNQTADDAVWPPPPSTGPSTVVDASDLTLALPGVDYTQSADRAVVHNKRARASTVASLLSQAVVLLMTIRVQYESMLWFQNVWGFRGRAVAVEIALQALVWIGMATAYVLIDRAKYDHYSRFRATFDRAGDRFTEGRRHSGPLARIAAVDVRRQTSLFARWYEVRLLLARTGPKADYHAVDERILGSFQSEADAHRLAQALTAYLGRG